MKKYVGILFAIVASITLSGCQSGATGATKTDDGLFMFSATGQSVANMSDPMSIVKAEVAAATTAKANLLEELKGALVSGSTKVSNLTLDSQTATTAVSGWISRIETVTSSTEPKMSNLPQQLPESQIITATAMLKLTKKEIKDISKFVE